MPSQDEVQSDLAALLADFQGREYSGEITEKTRFFADLGFASIDAVVLGESLEQHYGCTIPFQRFLAQIAAQDIEVGQLAKFLCQCLDG